MPTISWNPDDLTSSTGEWKLRRSSDLIHWELWDGDLTSQNSVSFSETRREYYSLSVLPDLVSSPS